jgi:predicted glutamine amidotransferase
MCIAINSPKGTSPTKGALETSFDYNPDGAGYCFAKNGKIIIRKGFFSFKSFLKSYQRDDIQGLNKLIHFRIATSGQVDKANCHPFLITDEVAMIHNGIIPHFGNKKENDTLQFAKLVLRPIIKENGVKILLNSSIQKMIIDSIGNSKLAFLDNQGSSYIINEQKGHRHHKIWYSNDTYKTRNSFSFYKSEFTFDAELCAECYAELKFDEYDICNYCEELEPTNGYGKPNQRIIKGIA